MSYYESDYFDAGSDDTETPIRPFIGIPPVFLPAAVAGFQVHYAPWMLSILREFQPYRELLDYARSEDLIEGQFSQFQSQPESARSELQNFLKSDHGEQWHEKIIGRHERYIQKIKGIGDNVLGDQWAFKTIFQKAFLRLGKQLVLNSTDEEKERMGTVADLISFMDLLYQRNILRVCAPLPGNTHLFWTFIAINYGNRKIKVSTQTEKKIGDILLLVYIGWRYAIHRGMVISNTTSESTITPRSVFKDISPKTAHTMWGAHDAATSLLNLMKDNATIISPSLGESEANDTIQMADLEKEKNKIARNRVIDLLASCWISPTESNESTQVAEAHDIDMI
jgi:hypothetical protein